MFQNMKSSKSVLHILNTPQKKLSKRILALEDFSYYIENIRKARNNISIKATKEEISTLVALNSKVNSLEFSSQSDIEGLKASLNSMLATEKPETLLTLEGLLKGALEKAGSDYLIPALSAIRDGWEQILVEDTRKFLGGLSETSMQSMKKSAKFLEIALKSCNIAYGISAAAVILGSVVAIGYKAYDLITNTRLIEQTRHPLATITIFLTGFIAAIGALEGTFRLGNKLRAGVSAREDFMDEVEFRIRSFYEKVNIQGIIDQIK